MTRFVVALFAFASLAAGCAGILGIEELPAGSDAGAHADSSTPGPDGGNRDAQDEDAGSPDSAPDAPPCARPDAGTVTPAELEWALWPMPNSPTDVEGGAPNLESYTDNGDGTVTDDVTGLMWQKTGSGTLTQDGALAYCAQLTVGSQADWHLPTYVELVSIVDVSQEGPAIDPAYFPGTASAIYWSSTVAADTTTADGSVEAWDVSFMDGHTNRDVASTGLHHARCVRRPGVMVVAPDAGGTCSHYSVTPIAPDMQDAAQQALVQDNLTGLTWTYVPPRGTAGNDSWTGSKGYCHNQLLGNQSGWRLPTIKELLTLVDVTQGTPALDRNAFSTSYSQDFWSWSLAVGGPVDDAGKPLDGWIINLGPGTTTMYATNRGAGVRCVR
jgi:hypothetical protein